MTCGCFSAWQDQRPAAGAGGKARSTISTSASSISASGAAWTFGDAPPVRHPPRVRLGARGDRHHREARLPVGREVALGHDHARADAADPDVARPHGHVRLEAACRPGPSPASIAGAARGVQLDPRPRCPQPRQARRYRKTLSFSSPAAASPSTSLSIPSRVSASLKPTRKTTRRDLSLSSAPPAMTGCDDE